MNTRPRPENTPARDAAWGRYYARRGLAPVQRCSFGSSEGCRPPSPRERLTAWIYRAALHEARQRAKEIANVY